MSEQNTNTAATPEVTPAATPAPAPEKVKKQFRKATPADKASKGSFATREAADAAKPDNTNFQVIRVTKPNGDTVYTWEGSAQWGIFNIAKIDGYKAEFADKPAVKATKEDVGAAFSKLTPEEQAALIAQFVPAAAPTPEAAPAAAKKGGKK